jgi:murein L,D-transpeptidase YafK
MMTFKTLVPILVLAFVAGAAHSDALPEARPVMLRPTAETLPVVDRVVVRKAERRLLLMHGGSLVRSYHVALGLSPVGQKERSGDFRTP